SDEFTFGENKYQVPRYVSAILSCDTNGEIKWFTSMDCSITNLAVDENRNLYATGHLGSEVTFDGGLSLIPGLFGSNFVLKYKSDKSMQWAKKIDADGNWPSYIAASNDMIY